MRYLAISGEDSSTYLLVCDKSCFVHSKSVHVLLAQARPAMINHHTSVTAVAALCCTVAKVDKSAVTAKWEARSVTAVGRV